VVNFLQHKDEIISSFCNTFKKIAYKSIWGIELNCNIKDPEIVWFQKKLLEYQQESDCCNECTLSYQPKNCIKIQSGTNSIPTYPFIQLHVCLQPTICTYTLSGDFNNDFNNDFFK